jgi:hypothetical protein
MMSAGTGAGSGRGGVNANADAAPPVGMGAPRTFSIGRPMSLGMRLTICISPGAHQYLFSSNSSGTGDMENGEIYKMELNGKIIGSSERRGSL